MKKQLIATTAMIFAIASFDNANAWGFKRSNQPTPQPQTQSMTPEIQIPGQISTPTNPNVATPAPQTQTRARGPNRGRRNATPAATTPAPVAQPQQIYATPQQRQAARSLDLVSQSTFWVNEYEKNHADAEAAYEASNALRLIGSHRRAIEIAAGGIQANESNPKLWKALALGLVGNKDYENALPAVAKAIVLNPTDATLKNAQGIAYDSVGRSDLAVGAYNEALAILPNDSGILTNLGLSKALNGDLAGAEATLRQAVSAPNPPVQARQNLALIVGLQGRLEESERLAAVDVPPDVAARNIAYIRSMLNPTTTNENSAADNNRNQIVSQRN